MTFWIFVQHFGLLILLCNKWFTPELSWYTTEDWMCTGQIWRYKRQELQCTADWRYLAGGCGETDRTGGALLKTGEGKDRVGVREFAFSVFVLQLFVHAQQCIRKITSDSNYKTWSWFLNCFHSESYDISPLYINLFIHFLYFFCIILFKFSFHGFFKGIE